MCATGRGQRAGLGQQALQIALQAVSQSEVAVRAEGTPAPNGEP